MSNRIKDEKSPEKAVINQLRSINERQKEQRDNKEHTTSSPREEADDSGGEKRIGNDKERRMENADAKEIGARCNANNELTQKMLNKKQQGVLRHT
ncbi:MAG: hypothetical protein WAN91_06105, partial [Saccharofermentanales bacterium]